ncbi:MAG: hypothetical protein H0W78_15315 [Planctomycetes bacterium]|nr:hypothetical protein [Planctomycetota bacterium]
MKRSARNHRNGTVLIIVSALSALLVSLALTFLTRVRSDVEEGELQYQLAQARVTLVAACQYIQESSRIGWGADTGREHAEAFGWIDVRDSTLGPRIASAGVVPAAAGSRPADPGGDGAARFPIGVPQRFDLWVHDVPPFAISMRAAYNPVDTAAPDNGRAYLRYPDPQPARALNGWAGTTANPAAGVTAANFAAWCDGKQTPRQATVGRTWFRLVREPTGAVFTVTCGAGGARGFRTWLEVATAGEQALFNNDETFFNTLRANELRLWYRVEWSPATTVIDMNFLREHEEHSYRVSTPTHAGGNPDNGYSGQQMAPNMGGTIQWIQRLRHEPDVW